MLIAIVAVSPDLIESNSDSTILLKELIPAFNHNSELLDKATRDIANCKDLDDLRDKFGGNKYLIDKINEYDSKNIDQNESNDTNEII